MKNNKGLSTVVTTLIIVLLVLVSISIIWGVITNLFGQSGGTIELGSKCLSIDVEAVKVLNNGDGTYDVTITRKPTGEDEVGVKVVFFSDDENSEPIDFGEMFSPLESRTKTLTVGFNDSNRVEVTSYFLNNDTGKESLCSKTSKFSFSSNTPVTGGITALAIVTDSLPDFKVEEKYDALIETSGCNNSCVFDIVNVLEKEVNPVNWVQRRLPSNFRENDPFAGELILPMGVSFDSGGDSARIYHPSRANPIPATKLYENRPRDFSIVISVTKDEDVLLKTYNISLIE